MSNPTAELCAVPCKLLPGEWLVEEIDNDGGVLMTRFSGPRAESRALAYASLHSAIPGTTAVLDHGDMACTLTDENLQIDIMGSSDCVVIKHDAVRALKEWLNRVVT